MQIRVLFIIIIGLGALVIGLLLRRLVVRRLKRTILDSWLVQLLGILVIVPPLVVAAISAPFVIENSALSDFWNGLLKHLQGQDVTSIAWGLIETVLVMVLGIGVARTLMRVTVRGFGENRLDINLRTLIGRIFYGITITIVIFWLLSIWHVAIDLPVAVLGTLTVAFTFAIQDILKDLVAGLYLLMERPFYIGDVITVCQAGLPLYTGKVENVQIRATKLRLVSGEQVMAPNTLVFGGIVINNTYYEERRATITLALPQEAFKKGETPEQILKILQEQATVQTKPEPRVAISGFTGDLMTLTVRFWLEKQDVSSVSEVMYALHTLLPQANVTLVEAAGNM